MHNWRTASFQTRRTGASLLALRCCRSWWTWWTYGQRCARALVTWSLLTALESKSLPAASVVLWTQEAPPK